MWQLPWSYGESIAVVTGVVAVGWSLQLTAGSFDIGLLRWPANLICGSVLLLAAVLVAVKSGNAFCRWLAGTPLAVTLAGVFVVLGVVMGLTPQIFLGAEPQGGIPSQLGFDHMTASWTFVLIYGMLLLSLGAVALHRLIHFRIKDYAFYLNHLGLWLALFAAAAGAADMKRYVMHVREGETEWRVYNEQGDILDLPIAISLKDFRLEEYPPKLAVIDRTTGEAFPAGKPHYFALDDAPEGRIGDWEFRLDEYIHDAVRNSDSTYHQVFMPGASPAARVSIRNAQTGAECDGWVCAGNSAQLPMTLNLDATYAVAMTVAEPKKFLSDIEAYTEDGQTAQTTLEVNHPLRIDSWMIYQYDYDKQAGRMSAYSSFELVYDPWLVPAYVGLAMLMAGSAAMLWSGRRRKEKMQ